MNPERNRLRKNELVEVVESDDETPIKLEKKKSKVKNLKNPPKAKSTRAESATGAEFLRDARWPNVLIPTLTHALYNSREPFVHFTSESSTFLATVQNAFDLSFTNIDFALTSDDPLVTTAYKRLNSRQSKLAGDILQAIKKFFDKPEFLKQPAKIREYVHWALRGDGPAYYQIPTPQSCSVPRDDPGYIAPDGFLQSEFIAPIAMQYLRYIEGSVLPALDAKCPPKGLYTLLLTAVERGFTAFATGTYAEPPLFAHKNCWRPLQVFLGHVDRVSERRWGLILELEKNTATEEEDVYGDQSAISAYRKDLYIPSSPQKA